MNILMDFAETIGFRIKNDVESDLEIVNKVTNVELEELENIIALKKIKLDIYTNKPFKYKSLSSEMATYRKYFEDLLSFLGRNKELADSILTKKILSSRHAVFSDAKIFLERHYKAHKIIIVSDGKPSRRLTIENLGLDKYVKTIYISDVVGYLKKNPKFFREVLTKEGISSVDTILIDDDIKCIKAADTCGIKTYLISRKRVLPNALVSLNSFEMIK